jgi:hypothetical protein
VRVLAIDFGTSNTVAMVRTPDSRMRPLLFDGSPLLPSALYLNTDGKVLVGRDAERKARRDPARFEPNPKRRIDAGEVFIGGQSMPVPRLFAHLFARVATEARRQFGLPLDEVRLTYPARWGERRRSVLVEAASIAGFANPRLVAEPVGAAAYLTAVLGAAAPVGRSLGIYDLGGGAFDATVVRRTHSGFEVLAEEGLADVSGLDFDDAIMLHLRDTDVGGGVRWASIAYPADAKDHWRRELLYEDVRGAKEMLSRAASTDIRLPRSERAVYLTRETLEDLVRPSLVRTVSSLRRAIDSARLRPKDLVGIFLVGGSSRIPLVGHLIHTELGVAPTTLEQPETVVVEGALCIGASRAHVPVTASWPAQGWSLPVSAAPVPQLPTSAGPFESLGVRTAVGAPHIAPMWIAPTSPAPIGNQSLGRLPDPARSSAVILGVAAYEDPAILDLPAVRNNVEDLAQLLCQPRFGGFQRDRVHVVLDPAQTNVAAQVARIARETQDVLLVYYAGHGLVDDDGDLYLGLRGTMAEDVPFTALPFHLLRRAVIESPAQARVAILDCCYSGRAIMAMAAGAQLNGQLHIAGAYTLTATAANVTAHAPVGERHTAFTGGLIEVLTTGVPGAGDLLRLADLHPVLSAKLASRNRPRPRQQGSDTVGQLALTRNRAGS